MSETHRGNKHYNWKGGKIKQMGYVYIWKFNHPFKSKDNYVLRSRLVMEKHIGRFLTPEEIVHHRGIKYHIKSIENKQDDRIENLKLFPNKSEHSRFHCYLKKYN